MLRSPSFDSYGEIPTRHSCEGAGTSPALSWSGVPPGTRSLALIVDDPDAPDPSHPRMTFVHWLLYDLPPGIGGLAEGVTRLPAGTHKRVTWSAPCPPIGRHRYFFELYALDRELPEPGPGDKPGLERAVAGHVLGKAELVGLYRKKRPAAAPGSSPDRL